MAATLRSLGFIVVEVRDGSREQMAAAIASVGSSLKGKQGIGMLYYAGHGLQLDWRNYMVPVDARLRTAADVPAQTVDLGSVIEAFKAAGNRMNIVVLDACRDNPFTGTSSGKGLAQLDAPPGTILAYATAPGNVAEDGQGLSNGLYTGYLLEELKKPVAKIEDVFKRVRLQVRQKSQGRQIPWESTSLEEDFVFNNGKVVVAAKPAESTREQAFNQEKAEWERVKASASVDDFYEFLKKYPSGSMSELAQTRVERLQKAQVRVQADREGRVQDLFDRRYREGDTYEFVLKDGLTNVQTGRGSVVVRVRGEDEVEGVGTGFPNARATRAGFVVQDGGGTYDPPWSAVPGGDFQVGKRIAGRSIRTAPNGDKYWLDYETRIVAREKLQTSLGLLDTYRVEVSMLFQIGSRSQLTFWYEPEWGYAVKTRFEFRNPGTRAPDIRIREMVARSRVN
ncbi:MAG: caspase family protein [Comamonadaceae bacterium]|nr:MAG: caspase family protein [Comamonadaceae bacterium]